MPCRVTTFLSVLLFASLGRTYSLGHFFEASSVDFTGLLAVIESLSYRRELTAHGQHEASRCALHCVFHQNCTTFEVCTHHADATCNLMQILTTSYPVYNASSDCDLYTHVNEIQIETSTTMNTPFYSDLINDMIYFVLLNIVKQFLGNGDHQIQYCL